MTTWTQRSGGYYAVFSALRRRQIFRRVPTAIESRGPDSSDITHRKPRDEAPKNKNGRDDTAADGLVAAAAAAAQKKLAPVALRPRLINSVEAFIIFKTAAAAAAAATTKPAHEAAARIARRAFACQITYSG